MSSHPKHSLRPIVEAVEQRAVTTTRSVTAICSLLLILLGADLLLLSQAIALLPFTILQGLALGAALHRALVRLRESGPEQRTLSRGLLIAALLILALFWVEKLQMSLEAFRSSEQVYRQSYRSSSALLTLVGIATALGRKQRLARFFVAFANAPARQSALSFVALALFGGVVLTLPLCARDALHASFLDALGRDLRGGTHSVMPVPADYRIRPGDTLMLVADERSMAKFLADHGG